MDHADSSPSVHASLPPSTPAVPVETASEPIVAGTFDIAVVGESSGVARSVRNTGWVYVLDDGPGSTGVLAIDTATNATTTVTVAGLEGRDTEGLAVGQPVLIADHINLTGGSPVSGPLPAEGVPIRFVDLTDLYSARLRGLARDVDPSLEEGVYAALPGPHYETPAEIRMLRTLGADLVGMSTALEAIAAAATAP